MLLVKTVLHESKIHGIGCFAAERIPKGTPIWIFHTAIDTVHSEEQLRSLSPACEEQIRKYAYFHDFLKGYVLCGDDSRFFNHSETPSCLDEQPDGVTNCTSALRDIEIGEELTSNYRSFTKTIGDDIP